MQETKNSSQNITIINGRIYVDWNLIMFEPSCKLLPMVNSVLNFVLLIFSNIVAIKQMLSLARNAFELSIKEFL